MGRKSVIETTGTSRLRVALFVCGRRQYEVAAAAGMTETRLSRIALGRVQASADEMQRIAEVLGKPVVELFESERPAA